MAENPSNNPPPAAPAPAQKSPVITKLDELRKKATELDAELHPLTKDAPIPGGQQKTARRVQKLVGLFVELCDVVEAKLEKGKK